jgi:hypothetical protein
MKHKRNENNKLTPTQHTPPPPYNLNLAQVIQNVTGKLTFSLQIGHNDTLINTGNKSLYKTKCYEETNIDFVVTISNI